jgi:hypothetical protein
MFTKVCITYPAPSTHTPHNSLWQSPYLDIGIGATGKMLNNVYILYLQKLVFLCISDNDYTIAILSKILHSLVKKLLHFHYLIKFISLFY